MERISKTLQCCLFCCCCLSVKNTSVSSNYVRVKNKQKKELKNTQHTFTSREGHGGKLLYFTLHMSQLFEYFMICTACTIQKRKEQFFKISYLLPRKKLGSSCSYYKFDQTHWREQNKGKLPTVPSARTLFSQIRLTPSLPSSFPLKYHLI